MESRITVPRPFGVWSEIALESEPARKAGGMGILDPYFLASERLGFRVWTEADMTLAISLWGDIDVTRLFDARGRLTESQVLEKLHKELATQETHGVQYWPIFLLESDAFAGCCGLRPYKSDRCICEFGVHLRPSYWGLGLATEGGRAVIRYAFETLKLITLFAGHHPDNDRSRYLLVKLGFEYTHDEYYAATGFSHPSYLLTRDGFETKSH